MDGGQRRAGGLIASIHSNRVFWVIERQCFIVILRTEVRRYSVHIIHSQYNIPFKPVAQRNGRCIECSEQCVEMHPNDFQDIQ